MKKVLFFLLVLLMVPCIVFADSTYAQGTKKTDTYIYTYNDYARYIYVTGDLNYGFSGGKAVPVAEFKYGGFISQEEYSITNSGSYASWLAPGIQYWLIGKSKLDTRLLAGNDTDKSGVRITEYVLHDTKVTGAGTKTNPWVFVDGYSLKVGVSDSYVGTVSPSNGYEHVSPDDEAKVFGLKYDPKYSLDTSSCSAAVASVGGTFNITNGDSAGTKNITIGNVKSDVSCIINFGTDCLRISFNNNGSENTDGLNGKSFYYKYGKGWFGDSSCKTPLSITITSPTRPGYSFQGYKYISDGNGTNGKVIVGPDNKIKPGINDADVKSGTAYAIWKDVIKPTCTINATESGVTMTYSDNDSVSNYGLTTTNSVSYNSTTTGSLEDDTTYYGWVKDPAGNTGKCSTTIDATYVSSYTVKSKKCGVTGQTVSGSYSSSSSCTTSTCSKSGCSCTTTASGTYYTVGWKCINGGKICENGDLARDDVAHSCTTSTCSKTGCSCKKKASGTYSSSHSCTTSTCSKSVCTCKDNYGFGSETTKTGQTSCTPKKITCDSSNDGKTNVTCTPTEYSCPSSEFTKINNEYCYKNN